MASELPDSSTASAAFYEFHEPEVIEFDEDTIRELLEEAEEEVQDNNYCLSESMEVQINHNNIKMENCNSLEKIDQAPAAGENYIWLDSMETAAPPAAGMLPYNINDLPLWYTDACFSEEMMVINGTSEKRETIDNSQMYGAFHMDEVAYSLWQDN